MNASKLLAGGLLVGIGLATGGATLSAVAAGVGVNWLGEGATGFWAGLAAPPQDALARAYAAAIRNGVDGLKEQYSKTVDSNSNLKAFSLVAACADKVAVAEFPTGAVDADGVQRTLAGALAALLHGHDPRQVAFLGRALLPACARAFQTQLLKDEAAWRAFHGLILQGLARNIGELTTFMGDFPKLLAEWGNPDVSLAHLRRAEEKIDTLARQPASTPIFDNRGMRVGGNVYQAAGDQYVGSAHAEGGGAATVFNTFGAPPQASTTPAASPSAPGTILLLAANPLGTDRLRLDEEARQITAALRQGGRRLDLAQAWAARGDDLLDALLHHRPAIVHFAGHGDVNCLILEGADGEPAVLEGEALVGLLGVGGSVRCVILNACWSDSMAEGLLRVIPCVVGMSAEVVDRAAVTFAAGFYRTLAAGQNVGDAVAGGQAHLLACGFPAELSGQVRLRWAAGVDLSALRF